MRYRGFIVTSRFGRWTEEQDKLVVKKWFSFYCQIYSGNDHQHKEMLEEFELVASRDIANMSSSELNRGIVRYIDTRYAYLEKAVGEMRSKRNSTLNRQLLYYLEKNMDGTALYNMLCNEIKMNDGEIQEAGLLSLAEYFDRESYSQMIAEYLIDKGTAETLSGDYHFNYGNINRRFGVQLPADTELLGLIEKNLDKEIVSSSLMDNSEIDLTFFTQYCPNANGEPENQINSAAADSLGMEVNDFIRNVRDMIEGKDKTAALNWIEFAQDLSDSLDDPLENGLLEIYRPLCYVRNNFSNAVLQKSLNTTILGSEIIFGAMLFSAGYGEEEVRRLANEGALECGYIPLSDSEKGSLSLVYIAETDILFVAVNETPGSLLAGVSKAAGIATDDQKNIEAVLLSPGMDMRLQQIGNSKLADAAKIALTASSAFDHIVVYDSVEQNVKLFSLLELTPEQNKAIFSSDFPGNGFIPQV